jgi:1,4-dihydroxy-2-naphthoate octaprenyltransferase
MVGLLRMSRPGPLVAALLAWLLGVSMLYGSGSRFSPSSFVLGFASVLMTILSLHYANEYADYETDSLTRRTFYSGGSGVLPSGLVARGVALQASAASIVLGLTLQILGALYGLLSWAGLVGLVLGAFFGYMYSLPPLKLSYRGLGELDNSLLGGASAPLLAYVNLGGTLEASVLAACIPFTLLVFNNLLASTWPDRAADRKAGKLTLATLWTKGRLRRLYWTIAAAAFVTLLILYLSHHLPLLVAATGLLSLPLSLLGGLQYTKATISRAAIYAMVVMECSQIVTWLLVGSPPILGGFW